jgi:site-specific DNA-methyltransferase (cytosine-N4-specific)
MREWPEESVDFVMTSPPYWGLRNYGESTETMWGGKEDCEHEWKIGIKKGTTGGVCKLKGAGRAITEARYIPDSEHAFCVKCGCWKGQLGLEPTWQMYVQHIRMICLEIKRVLKKTGSMYIVLGDTYAGSGQGHKISEQREAYKKYSKDLNFPYERPTVKVEDYQPKCLMGIPWRVAFALIEDDSGDFYRLKKEFNNLEVIAITDNNALQRPREATRIHQLHPRP